MNFSRSQPKTPLPFDKETAEELCRQIRKGDLLRFAQSHILTEKHLLLKNTRGITPLAWAAEEGHLDQVAEVLNASGEKLTLEHFLMKTDIHLIQNPYVPAPYPTHTILEHTAAHHHLAQVFSPSLWAKREGEMMELWKDVPKKDRGQIDFEAVIAQTIQAGLPPAQKWNEEAFASAARPSGYKKSERSERTHHHVPFY